MKSRVLSDDKLLTFRDHPVGAEYLRALSHHAPDRLPLGIYDGIIHDDRIVHLSKGDLTAAQETDLLGVLMLLEEAGDSLLALH